MLNAFSQIKKKASPSFAKQIAPTMYLLRFRNINQVVDATRENFTCLVFGHSGEEIYFAPKLEFRCWKIDHQALMDLGRAFPSDATVQMGTHSRGGYRTGYAGRVIQACGKKSLSTLF